MKPSPALLLALLAVVGVWAGPALARTLITGRDIAPNSVTGRNVEGLSGRDIVPNGLDGSDIDEQSLDIVPRAGLANRAKQVQGVRFSRFSYADPTGKRVTFLDQGGLLVSGFCNDGNLEAAASTTEEDALIRVAVTTPTTATRVESDNTFGPGEYIDLLPGTLNDASGTLTYYAPGGDTVTVTYLAQDGLPAATGHQCVIAGSAVRSRP